MLELKRELREVLFYNNKQPDLHYEVHHIHKGEHFTGIVKLRIKRGDAPYVVRYCYNGGVFETKEEVEAAFNECGFQKRGGRR